MKRLNTEFTLVSIAPCNTGHRVVYRALAEGRYFERPVTAWGTYTVRSYPLEPGAEGGLRIRLRQVPYPLVATPRGALVRASTCWGFLMVLEPHEHFHGPLAPPKGRVVGRRATGARMGQTEPLLIRTKRRGFDAQGVAAEDIEFLTEQPVHHVHHIHRRDK
jgi:hypothetical protein